MGALDVSGYLDDGALTLEGVASKRCPEGRSYKVEPLSWPDTILLKRIVGKWGGRIPTAAAMTAEDAADLSAFITAPDGTVIDLNEKLLGPALQEMVDDGVPPPNVERLVTVAALHFGAHESVAQQFVAVTAGEAEARRNRAPKPPAAAGARKRASSPSKGGSRSSRASGAANTPRSKAPASTRGRGTSTVVEDSPPLAV